MGQEKREKTGQNNEHWCQAPLWPIPHGSNAPSMRKSLQMEPFRSGETPLQAFCGPWGGYCGPSPKPIQGSLQPETRIWPYFGRRVIDAILGAHFYGATPHFWWSPPLEWPKRTARSEFCPPVAPLALFWAVRAWVVGSLVGYWGQVKKKVQF